MIRIALVISLSINIFVFSCLAMYGAWLATEELLTTFWRGITSLFVWIGTFGVGATVFWRIVEKMTDPVVIEAKVP